MTEQTTTHTYTVDEAAEVLKVHPRTVTRLIQQGELPAGKVGRALVLKHTDVMAYLDKVITAQHAGLLTSLRKAQPTRSTPATRGRPRASIPASLRIA